MLHYHSVVNISKEIVRFNNPEADELKELIIEYMEEVKCINYSNNINSNKTKSLYLYEKHIDPIGSYLINKSRFEPRLSISFSLILGIILDIVIYYNFTKNIIPLVTFLSVLITALVNNRKRRKGKSYSLFY